MAVNKVRYTVTFPTLADVVAFFGQERYFAVEHLFEQGVNVVLFPAAVLNADFSDLDPAWTLIQSMDRKPLALSRAKPGGDGLLSPQG